MEIYLVGGAVRDRLLGLPVKEKDYVVVGATVQQMLEKGFKQVGKDFPVFLHPETKEEYALARKERKTSPGYTGFEFDSSPRVSLQDDLMRRDLTINAIAEDATGRLVDPYHGKLDLRKKVLRHVSDAFIEDPVRILRVARFAARFAPLKFKVSKKTINLMKKMVKLGEVDALVPERVWKEWERALQEKSPQVFFDVLQECSAAKQIFPQFTRKNFRALKIASKKTEDAEIRFAILCFGLNKEELISLCENFRVPNNYKELALLVTNQYPEYLKLRKFTSEQILDFLTRVDAFRRHERFYKFLTACEILDKINKKRPSVNKLRLIYEILAGIELAEIMELGFKGKELGDAIRQKRIESIELLSKKAR